MTPNSLTINWKALRLEDQNGLIRYYLINVTETDTGSQFQYTSTTIDITLTDLRPYYTYSISVSAFTVSAGPWSDPIIVITAQDGKRNIILMYWIYYSLNCSSSF